MLKQTDPTIVAKLDELIAEVRLLRADLQREPSRSTVSSGAPENPSYIKLRKLRLTPKQNAILQLFLRGRNPFEIGDSLGISHNTVRTQIRAIKQKTGISSTSELIATLNGLFSDITDDQYLALSGGLPKQWVDLDQAARKKFEELLRPNRYD